jgi:hypothetical protein
MTPEKFWHWVGGRRFLLTVGSGLVNTLLRWFDKIDQMVFRDLIIATVGSYLTATAVQKWKEAKSVEAP